MKTKVQLNCFVVKLKWIDAEECAEKNQKKWSVTYYFIYKTYNTFYNIR